VTQCRKARDQGVRSRAASTPVPQRCRRRRPARLETRVVDHRYYDPATAQFLSVDPRVAVTGMPYAFTGGDPVNQSDPSGLCNDVQGKHVYDGPCTGAQLAQIDEAAVQARAAGVATGCSNLFACSIQADAGFVAQHAATLSTIASGLATVAYISCAATEGIGCGVGLALSSASTALSGINTYRACFGGAGGCASAATSFGLNALATGIGFGLQNAAAGGLANVFNSYARDVYLARQDGVIGGVVNGLSTTYSLLSNYARGCG